MVTDKEFARRMRAVRAYLDLTLDEAGAELDYSASHLSKMERADTTGHTFRKRDRQAIAAVYCSLSGWPPGFFTDEEIPPLARPRSDEDDLSPLEVVDRVEGRRDDDGVEVGPS